MPLSIDNIMPIAGEPQWVTDRICICEGTPAEGTNATIYAGSDIALWAVKLGEYLAEGKKVAVMGENARLVIEAHLNA